MKETLDKKDIQQILISFDVNGENDFSLMISREGSINRRGKTDKPGKNFFIMGKGNPEMFLTILKGLQDEWLAWVGRYEYPDPKGDTCHLSISLSGEGVDTGLAFQYGSQSEGPPEEIVQWVEQALEITEPWLQDQRKH